MPSPSIAVIIDQSSSMAPGFWDKDEAYLSSAQTAAASFVNTMEDGDYLGVVAFSDDAKAIFPKTGPAIPIVSQATKDQAAAAIQALKPLKNTNIDAGISAGMSLIGNVNPGEPKGMVLLSDGAATLGVVDPYQMTVPGYPMYTIALGIHGALTTMQVLAQRTQGTSYISPTPFDLNAIYNDIVAEASIAATLANRPEHVPSNNYRIISATFPAGAPNGTFTVTWGNTAVTYAPSTPTRNQVNVSLRDPKGKAVPAKPAASGPGYVVFRIPNPQPGTYQAAVWYSGTIASSVLPTTTGIFSSDTSLMLKASFSEASVAAGKTLRFAAEVQDGGKAVPGARIDASLHYPLISSEAALLAHRDRLERIGAELAPQAGGELSDNAKMWALQSRLGPTELLQPYGERPVATGSRGAVHHGECSTSATGGHLLYLQATGVSPHSGRQFSLTRCLSALVT